MYSGEYQRPGGAPAIDLLKMIGKHFDYGLDAVYNRITPDGDIRPSEDYLRIQLFSHIPQGNRILVLADAADGVYSQDVPPHVLIGSEHIAATALVYAQQGIYDLGDDHYAGGLASAALVIGYNRGRYAQMVGQVGLGNGEVATPLSQGITRI